MYDYKVSEECPFCGGEGIIEIVKEVNSGKLFCMCCECESEWSHPKQLLAKTEAPVYDGKVCTPDKEDVIEFGWSRYVIGVELFVGLPSQKEDRTETVTNAFGETFSDRLQNQANVFRFQNGKIYGVIGEKGSGGEILSQMLCGMIPVEGKIQYWEEDVDSQTLSRLGIYVDFLEKLYRLSKSGSKLYYCFPWLNRMRMKKITENKDVIKLLKYMKEDGYIIIIPTESRGVLEGVADEIIELGQVSRI